VHSYATPGNVSPWRAKLATDKARLLTHKKLAQETFAQRVGDLFKAVTYTNALAVV
jgi:hypothetical protein